MGYIYNAEERADLLTRYSEEEVAKFEAINKNWISEEEFNYFWSDFKQNFYPCNVDTWLNNRLVVEHFTNYMKEHEPGISNHACFITYRWDLFDRSKKLPSPKNRQRLYEKLWSHWSNEHHSMIQYYHYDFCHCLGQFESWVAYYIPELEGHPEFVKFCDELARENEGYMV